MKNPKRPFGRASLIAGFALAAMMLHAAPARAIATQQFWGDTASLNYSNGTIGLSPFPFAGTANTWAPNEVGATPEGDQRVRMTINASGGVSWGGWGIQFFDYGPANAVVTQNLTAFNGGSLRFLLNSTEDLEVELQDNNSAAAILVASTGGNWKEIVFDLSLFQGNGIDLSQVKVMFLIKRQGSPDTATTFYVDHVRWTKQLASIELTPASAWHANGRKRQYTAIGKDAAGEEVIIYPDWSATGAGNSVSPALSSRYTILTIGNGSGNLRATMVTAHSGYTVQSPLKPINPVGPQDSRLGLLSESILGVLIGENADLGTYSGGGATIGLSDASGDVREGQIATQINLNVPNGGFAGFFIQHGLGANEAEVRNMADFYDGSIRFWLKAPSQFAGKIDMSIRTGGVSGELSKVTIGATHGAVFDNQWRPIVIPVAQFAKAVPYADLSRMKILFNLSVAQAASGTIFVDNLRWDTRTPGPLSSIVIKPTGTTTARVVIPKGIKRYFVARGYDGPNGTGVEVDIHPTWSVDGAIGTLNTSAGPRVRLDAAANPALGSLTASAGVSGTTYIDVANITFTQTFNVYSDAGAGGQIGLAPPPPNQNLFLSNPEHVPGNAPEGVRVMRATYTLTAVNNFATWFVYEVTGNRFLDAYKDGYIRFFVRTSRDLEVSLRSDNILPDQNGAKLRLSDIGVPLNGQWQEVWLALDDFKQQDLRLDFTQMKVYFGVAAIANQIGFVTNEVFDIDGVKWYTASGAVPDPEKVFNGIKAKQNATTGLLRSFDNVGTNNAVTYDQALGAMAMIYRRDTANAKKILDVYKGKYGTGAGFEGFHEEYDRDDPSFIRDADRTAGPNAWILLAALHWRAARAGQADATTYDAMMTGIANWLISLQAPDGAIRLGYMGGSLIGSKSTEHNFDVYAAFRALASVTGNNTYNVEADQILNWLNTEAFNAGQGRFNVGELSNGTANIDHALDAYSWAPLTLLNRNAVLDNVESLFVNTKTVDLTGFQMTGFDFSGYPGENVPPFGQAPDKDAVWIEGTAHMVVAYKWIGHMAKADFYMDELNKAVFETGPTTQGLAYASNAGTAYWYPSLMDSTHAALSSMAWYLFAVDGFNPLQPIPLVSVQVKNISNNQPASEVTWTVDVPARWTRANQYIEVASQGIDNRSTGWGLQIYTDNKNPANTPRFADPTPGVTSNFDSNPAGLVENVPGRPVTPYRLDMGWTVQDSTAPTPAAVQPYSALDGTGSFTWFYMKDKGSPAIDVNGDGDTTDPGDRPAFQPGETYVTVKSNEGIQVTFDDFFLTPSPDFIFLEADFTTAAAQVNYRTNLVLEYFFQ